MVALYYRQYGNTTWQDVSEYIGKKGLITWSQELGLNLVEFSFTLENPLDESNDPLIIEVGDDFVLCPDNNRDFVLGNCAGLVINNGKKIIAWDSKNDIPKLRYDIKVRQRDFSKDIAYFDYKTDTSLSTILDDIINTHSNDQLGGYLSYADQTINKYELLAPDITISSFDFQGKALKALIQLLNSIGYYFRIDYFIEPDSTYTLRLIGRLTVFNASGTPAGGVWAEGISNDTVRRGYIVNPYYIDADTTPEQPSILWGETLPELETDYESAKNYFNFIALVQDGLTLTREDFTQTNLDNFKLANKAKDIVYVARLVKDYVVSVSSTTIFTLPLGSSQKLLYDQQRLTDNNLGGQMVCKITSSGVEYIRVFTISSQIVTLTEAISTLSVNDMFELINSYDILEENLDIYPVDGYVIKHVRYDENGEVKFPKYDKPNPADTVVIHYYALSDYIKETYFQDSINKYGLFDFDLDIDYPLVTEQLTLINNEFYKYVDPLKTVKFKSLRPEPLTPGQSLSIDVTNLVSGQFLVNSVECKLIADKAYKNKYTLPDSQNNLLIEQTIELASYRNSLTEILAGFIPKLYNKTAIVDDKVVYANYSELQIFSQFAPGEATVTPVGPIPAYVDAYYNFDGNVNDQTGNGYNANIVSSGSITGNYYTNPNDATSYLNLPVALITSQTELTICFWAKINTLNKTGSFPGNTFISVGNATITNQLVLWYDDNNNRWTYRCNNSTDVNFGNTTLRDLNKHFVVFQLKYGSGSYAKLFIDNVATPINTLANASASLTGSLAFIMGQEIDSFSGSTPGGFTANQSMNSSIDNVSIAFSILNTSQLTELKNLTEDLP